MLTDIHRTGHSELSSEVTLLGAFGWDTISSCFLPILRDLAICLPQILLTQFCSNVTSKSLTIQPNFCLQYKDWHIIIHVAISLSK